MKKTKDIPLIIVESPTKAKTIERFVGSDAYRVIASMGHVRDLPKGSLGIDQEHDFEPRYVIPTKMRKKATMLKKEASRASRIILATDEDREGESISWHIAHILGSHDHASYERIVFHEITKEAIDHALAHPRTIDMNLVNAQQARRVLDRIVGYKLSPLLWKKIVRGLSAGRVQSVAVRLIVEREREIQKFVPQEYWSIEGTMCTQNANPSCFRAQLVGHDGKTIKKTDIGTKKEADAIVKDLQDSSCTISHIKNTSVKKNPPPPFLTSSLQQASWQKFKFPAKFTMGLAQFLYEKGYITYHRTDSLTVSSQAISSARTFIQNTYGAKYLPSTPKVFKKKGRTQEAHEAIRPTSIHADPDQLKALNANQKKLYTMIQQRFLASQMNPALYDAVRVDMKAGAYTFRANGQTMKFDGFTRVYPVQFEETTLPELQEGQDLEISSITPEQHFTQPVARYNEATLVKALEEYGIGRPSTYAPTISTIQARNYIEKNEQKRFVPTEIGIMVNDLLVEHFPNIVDTAFTAQMEDKLDSIAQNKVPWKEVVREFYMPFEETVKQKEDEIQKANLIEETDKTCPLCGSSAVLRFGRFGKFYGCSTFPECKWTAGREPEKIGVKCFQCKEGDIIVRTTKRKRIFYGCSAYPKCTFSSWDKPTGSTCSVCGKFLVEDKKHHVRCSNKECVQRKGIQEQEDQ